MTRENCRMSARGVIALGAALLATRVAHAQIWPNQPAGFQQLTSHSFTTPTGNGWGSPQPFQGIVIADPSAPVSPPQAIRCYRDATSSYGGDFGYEFGQNRAELFVAFAFRLSNPHYGWFDWYQKLLLIDNPTQHMYLHAWMEANNTKVSIRLLDECSSAYCNSHLHDPIGGGAIVNNVLQTTYANNVWHKVEIYYKGNTGNATSRTGILRMWVDGAQVMNHTNANLNPNAQDVWVANIWDSINTQLPQMEWVEYDHVYVSVPRVSGSDTLAPAAPSNLAVN